ncbi:unnamed protein product, partial [Ectocarpus fasciculatus]
VPQVSSVLFASEHLEKEFPKFRRCCLPLTLGKRVPQVSSVLFASEHLEKEFPKFRRCCLPLNTWKKSSPSSIVSNCDLCFFYSLAITGWVGYAPCSGLPFRCIPFPCGSHRRSTSPTSLDFFSPSSLPGGDYIIVVEIPSFSVVCMFCVFCLLYVVCFCFNIARLCKIWMASRINFRR